MNTTTLLTSAVATVIACLSACTSPEATIRPISDPFRAKLPIVTGQQGPVVDTWSPVVQITNYNQNPAGTKLLSLNGTTLRLAANLVNTYAYDQANRLIEQRTTAWNNPAWWETRSYQYQPDLIERYQTADNKDFTNTLLLNEKGYLKGDNGPGEYIYNADGFLIRYAGNGQKDTYTIKDGNIVAKETVYNSGAVLRNTYEYNLTRSAVPSPLTFRGQQSRNLLIQQTSITTSPTWNNTTVFTFRYDVDAQGRAIREFLTNDAFASDVNVREFVYS